MSPVELLNDDQGISVHCKHIATLLTQIFIAFLGKIVIF